MTITHHPSEELLLDYATGALGEAWSLAVATHLALCPVCRQTVTEMEAIGAGLMARLETEPVADDAFTDVLERIDAPLAPPAPAPAPPPVRAAGTKPLLPQPLRDYVGGDVAHLNWQRLGLGAYQKLIPTAGGSTARLLRIPAGQPVPEHGHRGLELTLVLDGAFSDQTGYYGAGDFQEADDNLQHQPHAAPDTDCICLAVTEAPLKFKDLSVRLVQPLLGI